MTKNDHAGFTIFLDRSAHQWAAQFAAQQASPAKGKRVYLNTLAVCAVQRYLSIVCQLETDLSQGDAWQPELQGVMDVADLVIPNLGSIECRPVLPNSTELLLPPEVINDLSETILGDRVGYVAVQFHEDLSSVELLGFVTNPTAESIGINRLQPLDDFLDFVYATRVYNLQKFLAGELGIGWEPIAAFTPKIVNNLIISDSVVANQQEYAVRNLPRDFTAGKIINLKAQISNIPLLLLIGLKSEPDGRVNMRARLHSAGEERTLPANLKLVLQGASGDCLSEVYYPQAMDFIQLHSFKLCHGTEFKIQVALGSHSFTESFIA
jgi:Protein of unknown function (DUF1822)